MDFPSRSPTAYPRSTVYRLGARPGEPKAVSDPESQEAILIATSFPVSVVARGIRWIGAAIFSPELSPAIICDHLEPKIDKPAIPADRKEQCSTRPDSAGSGEVDTVAIQ